MLKNENSVFGQGSEESFLRLALKVFRAQYRYNKVYRQWVDLLKVNPPEVRQLEEIPFLPIEFYKKLGFEIFVDHPFLFGEEWQTDHLMKLKI